LKDAGGYMQAVREIESSIAESSILTK
jgi:hypothetical protein